MKLSDHFQNTDCHGLPQMGEDGDRGTTVYLAIFEDRVEIRNPGDFPSELNTKKLFTPPQELSIPRNPLIANVLYMRKSIETWGRGLGVCRWGERSCGEGFGHDGGRGRLGQDSDGSWCWDLVG